MIVSYINYIIYIIKIVALKHFLKLFEIIKMIYKCNYYDRC